MIVLSLYVTVTVLFSSSHSTCAPSVSETALRGISVLSFTISGLTPSYLSKSTCFPRMNIPIESSLSSFLISAISPSISFLSSFGASWKISRRSFITSSASALFSLRIFFILLSSLRNSSFFSMFFSGLSGFLSK